MKIETIMIQKPLKKPLPIGNSRRIVTEALDAVYFLERKKRGDILAHYLECIRIEFLNNKCLPNENDNIEKRNCSR